MKRFSFYLLAVMLLITQAALGGVNLKNGNFYISYTDIVVPGGGNKLEITRTFNSKATKMGWFGFGWGSDYETYLKPSPDGSVIVHENGSGAETRFLPKGNVDAKGAAKKIVDAMKAKSNITEKFAQEMQTKLEGDAELRNQYANRYNIESTVAEGTVLYSNDRGLQELHRTKNGYKRVSNDGKTEVFNDIGNMTEILDKNGYSVKLEYDKQTNRLTSIKDSQAKQLFFDWYPDGKAKNIWSAGDKKTLYKYNGNNLVESTDVGGNTYKYAYDNFQNMTKVSYSDNTSMDVEYDTKTQFVTKITDRNKEATKYEYGSNPQNPLLHYWTLVTKKGYDGKDVTNRYEYEIKVRPDGSQYTYRIKTTINGVSTETVYHENFSLPLKITRGQEVTNFEYNNKGLLTKKTSSKGDDVQLDYDTKWNKISKVTNADGWTQFDYDEKGNLAKAVNSQGKAVLLIYDRMGRITKMVDDDKKSKQRRVLSFKYNPLGKPVEIEMEKVGTIKVAYDNYGEIKNVESKEGEKMAFQVTEAFQNLLSIVKPAGVDLSL